jgi:hypothetical protein
LAFLAECQIQAKKLNTPAYVGPGMVEQPQDCQSQSAFTRATLAYEAHDFAGENINTGPPQNAFPLWIIDGDID